MFFNSDHGTKLVAVLCAEISGKSYSELQIPCLRHAFVHFYQYSGVVAAYRGAIVAVVVRIGAENTVPVTVYVASDSYMVCHHAAIVQTQHRRTDNATEIGPSLSVYGVLIITIHAAVNTAVAAVGNIRDTSSSMGRTTVIEVMGRHCGDIALYAGLAGGAEDILIPEQAYDIDKICDEVKAGVARGKLHSIIIKAEGVALSTQALAEFLELKTGCETKTVLLGYIQRGGSPTARDRVLASRMGIKAAELVEQGAESAAIGIHGDEIIAVPLEEALQMKKKSHTDFIEICNALL